MKKKLTWVVLASICSLRCSEPLHAATSITPTNHFAWGANVGWVEGRGDSAKGAVIGEYVCSGYLYAANVGWIHLGNNTPTNGIQYQNRAHTDYGVNHDGVGNLRGYAWGANIGWVAFGSTGAPTVDMLTGNLRGYVYSANAGWISLSNSMAHVETAFIAAGVDTDRDGMADAWEYQHWGHLKPTAGYDDDRDGASNLEEYLADTDPQDAKDALRITSFWRGLYADSSRLDMTWTSSPTRQYIIQRRSAFDSGDWTDWGILPTPGANSAAWQDKGRQQFYRIRAVRPLLP